MNVKLVFSIAILLAACGFALAAKDKEKDKSTEHKIDIKNLKFSPATLDIKVGETVTWTNSDDHDHTVIADDDSFKSDTIGHGETFSYTFKTKGKFKYHCNLHP